MKFDRYRQQVVDKLKSSVSIRWWDKQTGAWLIPATNKCKAELDQLTYYVRHFEPVQWGTIAQSQTEEDVAFQIPEMPELDGEHGLKVQPYPYQLQGIARGLQLKRFINGDDMGLGKQQPVSSYVATQTASDGSESYKLETRYSAGDGNVYAVRACFQKRTPRVQSYVL